MESTHRMLHWHALSLGDAVTAHLPLERIKDTFEAEYPLATRPPGAAVFVRYDSTGRLHCEVTVYFSPAASALARHVGADLSAAPMPDGLELVAGDPTAWAVVSGSSEAP